MGARGPIWKGGHLCFRCVAAMKALHPCQFACEVTLAALWKPERLLRMEVMLAVMLMHQAGILRPAAQAILIPTLHRR